MTAFTAIELERLPFPEIIEALDFESIFQQRLEQFKSLSPDYSAVVESDPVYKLLEETGYRELIVRARINDAARRLMLATSRGSDLEHIGALFGVSRQTITPADPNASPPTDAVMESDTRLRERIQLSLEAFTTAGSAGGYEFWARTASGDVKDVDISSPVPGQVDVSVLSIIGDGTPDQALLDTVYATLSAEDVRPITDYVVMKTPEILHYSVSANLYTYSGPDPEVVRQAAEDAVLKYVTSNHLLGHNIELSGLYAALHQPGVQRVELLSPTAKINVSSQQAALCDSVTVTYAGEDE